VNPEDKVVDAIDALIDEQLAAGPHDDYNANYYPECDRCRHDWHGVECIYCGCDGDGPKYGPAQWPRVPYTDQSRLGIEPGAPWVRPRRDINWRVAIGPCPQTLTDPITGYTIADLEAMRDGFHPVGYLRDDIEVINNDRAFRMVSAQESYEVTVHVRETNRQDRFQQTVPMPTDGD
jgi:hypothetical protein